MTPAAGSGALIKRHYPDFDPTVVFDVGANNGNASVAFARTFPQATIYAFEPVTSVYRTLVATTEKHPHVQTFNIALGRRSGRVHVTKRAASPSNHVIESPHLFQRGKVEPVAITAGDEFAAEHGIDHIGFLKIDAEGYDLDVLVGFQGLLVGGRIDFVEAEVGMNPENRRHVPFEAVKAYLEPFGYRLIHLHDLAPDTPFSGRAILRRANAMFVSEAFADANRVDPKKS